MDFSPKALFLFNYTQAYPVHPVMPVMSISLYIFYCTINTGFVKVILKVKLKIVIIHDLFSDICLNGTKRTEKSRGKSAYCITIMSVIAVYQFSYQVF